MATQYSPQIVTNGLVLALDANNTKSYPGTGTAWKDLTNRGNNGTIGSGLTYSSGSFNFTLNSSNQLVTVPNSADLNYNYLNWCYSLWMKVNFDDDGTWTQLFVKGDGNAERRPGIWFYSGQTSRFHCTWGASGQGQIELNTSDPLTPPIGVWANYIFQSRNGVMMVFKNTVQDPVTVSIPDRAINSLPLYIGGFNFRSPGMDLANVLVYNRSLSNEEILQNYNAVKSRFGF